MKETTESIDKWAGLTPAVKDLTYKHVRANVMENINMRMAEANVAMCEAVKLLMPWIAEEVDAALNAADVPDANGVLVLGKQLQDTFEKYGIRFESSRNVANEKVMTIVRHRKPILRTQFKVYAHQSLTSEGNPDQWRVKLDMRHVWQADEARCALLCAKETTFDMVNE